MSVDHEREELRTSLIKSITKPKYNDLDDFVNWLNEPKMVRSIFGLNFFLEQSKVYGREYGIFVFRKQQRVFKD